MTLIGASLLSGIVGTLCPKKHQKYLRLLCGLCVIAAMVAPLPSYLADAEDSWLDAYAAHGTGDREAYEEIYRQTLASADQTALGTYLQSALMTEFSLKSDAVSVTVSLREESAGSVPSGATVHLSGSGILVDPRAVASYVEELLGCPCEVVYA